MNEPVGDKVRATYRIYICVAGARPGFPESFCSDPVIITVGQDMGSAVKLQNVLRQLAQSVVHTYKQNQPT